jgi:RNA polymerase sigma-32 factor
MTNGEIAVKDGFIKKLGKHPALSREEELRLAIRYRETGDRDAERRLVEGNLRLVVKIARGFCFRSSTLPDLVQEGTLGLMKAVTKYDPDRGLRLSTYAVWWIRAYIHQYNMTNGRMMRVVTTLPQRKLFYSLRKEQARVNATGETADPASLSVRLGVTEKDVIEMSERLNSREVALESSSGDGARNRGADLVDERPAPDEELANRQVRFAVSSLIRRVEATLGEREKVILSRRLTADEPITLRELGQEFGISRERARQLEKRLKEQLQPHLAPLAALEDSWAHAAA